MKRVIFLLTLIFILFFNSSVYAVCDDADINRLKAIAQNVEVSYEHNVYGNLDDEDGVLVSIYDITVAGLTDELYVMDDSGNIYYPEQAVDGILSIRTSSGKRSVFIYSRNCIIVLLDTRTLDLPTFNFNSLNEECKKIEFKDLDICASFIEDKDEVITNEEFEETVEKIEREQQSVWYKIRNFVSNHLVASLIVLVIVLVGIIVLFLRHRKRSVLE